MYAWIDLLTLFAIGFLSAIALVMIIEGKWKLAIIQIGLILPNIALFIVRHFA